MISGNFGLSFPSPRPHSLPLFSLITALQQIANSFLACFCSVSPLHLKPLLSDHNSVIFIFTVLFKEYPASTCVFRGGAVSGTPNQLRSFNRPRVSYSNHLLLFIRQDTFSISTTASTNGPPVLLLALGNPDLSSSTCCSQDAPSRRTQIDK